MKMVKHKYIVGMIEVLASKTKIFIVLDLVIGGELFDKIVSVGKLTEVQARFYFRQLVEGVEYCHKQGVCHRDLKPENLLLDEHGNLKISDFGLSSLYVGDADATDGAARTQLLHTTCGTPNYVAPEVLADKGYDGKKADVWSCGVILYVLLAGFLPFDEGTIVALFSKIQNADFTYPSWFTPQVRLLLDRMIIADPKVRISLTSVKEHDWFTDGGDEAGGSFNDSITLDVNTSSIIAPTNDQINAAVTTQSVSETDSNSNNLTGFYDDDNEDDELGSKSSRGPKALNAFELLSQCGGFLLEKMFNPNTINKLDGSPVLHRTTSGANRLFSTSYANSSKVSRTIHYTSALAAVDLIEAVYRALIEMGCTINASKDRVCGSGKLLATKITSKGAVATYIQSFEVCSTLSLLTIRKGKGDLLEWTNLFTDMTDNRLAYLINKAKS